MTLNEKNNYQRVGDHRGSSKEISEETGMAHVLTVWLMRPSRHVLKHRAVDLMGELVSLIITYSPH